MKSLFSLLTLLFASHLFAQPQFDLQVFASGLDSPVDIANAGDDRLFIVEKQGKIQIINPNGSVVPIPFLDISDRVGALDSEQGLLGLVFHPQYAQNGFFFVNYTDQSGNTHIARFQVRSDDPNQADPNSEKTLLTVNQPTSNHNGGDLSFGPDGFLYIGLGDGGAGVNGQNPQTFLGKMLRIDVDQGEPYAIPEDNPFVNTTSTLPEIWALGLRNPWRFSFDRLTGDLWIADVGQFVIEEVNFQQAGSKGGENYGWFCYEGDQPYNLNNCPPDSVFTFPVHVYRHVGCRSVTGGFVYRGSKFPNLQGYYIYADYCTGEIWGLVQNSDGTFTNIPLLDFSNFEIATFGEDQNSELFLASLKGGTIYQVVEKCNLLPPPQILASEGVLSVPDTFAAYQWFSNGQAVANAVASSFTPTVSASVTVRLTDELGCSLTSEAVIACVPGTTPQIFASEGTLSVPDTFAAYQWFADGKAVANATNASFTPGVSGTVTVLVVDELGCGVIAAAFTHCVPSQPPVIMENEGVLTVTDTFANYQWFVDGKAVANTNDSSFKPSASGKVTVKVTDELGCSVTSNTLTACVTGPRPQIIQIEGVLSVPDTFATYQWFVNGQAVANATGPSFIPGISGTVTAEVADDLGCSIISEPLLVTATTEALGITQWQVTPSPFRDFLRLEMELAEPVLIRISIYDAKGRLVFKDEADQAKKWSKEYQLQQLKSGIYILILSNGENFFSKKIIKN